MFPSFGINRLLPGDCIVIFLTILFLFILLCSPSPMPRSSTPSADEITIAWLRHMDTEVPPLHTTRERRAAHAQLQTVLGGPVIRPPTPLRFRSPALVKMPDQQTQSMVRPPHHMAATDAATEHGIVLARSPSKSAHQQMVAAINNSFDTWLLRFYTYAAQAVERATRGLPQNQVDRTMYLTLRDLLRQLHLNIDPVLRNPVHIAAGLQFFDERLALMEVAAAYHAQTDALRTTLQTAFEAHRLARLDQDRSLYRQNVVDAANRQAGVEYRNQQRYQDHLLKLHAHEQAQSGYWWRESGKTPRMDRLSSDVRPPEVPQDVTPVPVDDELISTFLVRPKLKVSRALPGPDFKHWRVGLNMPRPGAGGSGSGSLV